MANKSTTPQIDDIEKAIESQIQELRDSIKGVHDEIVKLEESIKPVEENISRLERSLRVLRGESAAPQSSSGRSGSTRVRVTDDQVDAALRDLVQANPDGITAKDLAAKLGISTQGAGNKINDAIERGVVATNGLERAARRIVAKE